MLDKRLRALRTAHGINQVTLAKALGVTKQCVCNWENDNVQPSIEMLVKLSQYFNVSCDYMLGLEEEGMLSVEGLNETEIAHIKMLIQDLLAAHRLAAGTTLEDEKGV